MSGTMNMNERIEEIILLALGVEHIRDTLPEKIARHNNLREEGK